MNGKAQVPDKTAGAGLPETTGADAGLVADKRQDPRRVCAPGALAGKGDKGRRSIRASSVRDGTARRQRVPSYEGLTDLQRSHEAHGFACRHGGSARAAHGFRRRLSDGCLPTRSDARQCASFSRHIGGPSTFSRRLARARGAAECGGHRCDRHRRPRESSVWASTGPGTSVALSGVWCSCARPNAPSSRGVLCRRGVGAG